MQCYLVLKGFINKKKIRRSKSNKVDFFTLFRKFHLVMITWIIETIIPCIQEVVFDISVILSLEGFSLLPPVKPMTIWWFYK